MNTSFLIKMSLALVATSLTLGVSHAGSDDKKKLIKHAQKAAPASLSHNATIVANGEVLREGTNSWVCMPDTMPGDGSSMCNDDVWMKMMNAIGSKADFSTDRIGISYMLLGDIGAGVSNSDPYHPDPKNADDYVETGPHLMIIVPKELLKGMTDDPTTGGPYVMWKDTPYAHIMIPVGKAK